MVKRQIIVQVLPVRGIVKRFLSGALATVFLRTGAAGIAPRAGSRPSGKKGSQNFIGVLPDIGLHTRTDAQENHG